MGHWRKITKWAKRLGPWGLVMDKSVRKRLGLTGKKVKSKLGLRFPSVSSASSYLAGKSYYGPTGSIIGKY